MKRALKKRVKAVLKNTPTSDDAPADQFNVVNNQANRRARRQAAMIGLAISMGATSLLVTRQSDQAQAAAPVGSQKAASSIPTATDSELKLASQLQNSRVLSTSVPENPVIMEPTAVSQLPGLEAKWQVLSSGMSVQVPASENITKNIAFHKTTINHQSQLAQGEQTTKPVKEIAAQLNNVNGVTAGQNILPTTQPQALADNTTASDGINAQLKAQQEFALSRLQEKSSRLRKSLAELRSEESKDLSKTTVGLTQPTSLANQLPPLTTNGTVIEQQLTVANGSQDSLATTIKQPQPINIPVQPLTETSASTANTYEVKPGDTLAAIASRYNTSVAELVKVNNLSNPNQLKISQQLIIPGRANNIIAQAPAIISSNSVQYPSTPTVPNFPVDTARVNPSLPVVQPPAIANNDSVPIAVPTPGANSETPVDTIVPLESASAPADTQGVGGNVPIPKAFIEIQRPQQPGKRVARAKGDRLRSLQAEIQRLQAKYRDQQTGNTSAPVVANQNNGIAIPIPVTSPNNFAVTRPISRQQEIAVPIAVPTPLAPNYSDQPVKPQFRATLPVNEPLNPEFLPNNAPRNPSIRRVATPPARLNASESLGRMRGTTVSPNLPPLAAVDQYLPQAIDENVPPPSDSSVALIWPTKGVLTSGYGWRWGRMHRGIDIANAVGTPVFAAADGVVEKSGWNKGGYGNLVDIRHPDGSLTRYAHNSRLLVQAGQQVRQGQQIAAMGSTGFSTGPHTHFEIHKSGKGAINPIAMLPATTSNRI
ncbi:peptidoglycan DD-metalloendopeptidase family protein [Trichormus variabilis ARAD]|uniref:Peptidoglycan DD-metalloendopeptidase family protein n=1 Tax=Trichormus variabilis N2B TaxID=2681315 RepID=A0ABR6SBL2_ANAVA|nr:peptidoglycan DD-metalloendopeptidase family protein [Trichormus variabilis ARAD]MBC1257431.1 peptidoglycan DD-metalloendopeptidase family protein [Trichormus variabilis V5]MBC1267278.1 peptidoglycan DD-metalloendopeptidase family protein [Trichormus variabilis FSR]MBC1303809.1 peptidoglycan DD-metalloendopeptidase family protein [Trichormus variabilis N2B]MBC1312066.1 peptidoglycan DD-metalloendopeptidase family protein [Trichormus variabilis PNB]MBC1328188.1 peptidoglycan DD-metalloendope